MDEDEKRERLGSVSVLGKIEIKTLAGIVVIGVGEILNDFDGVRKSGVPGAAVVSFTFALRIAIGTDSGVFFPCNKTIAVLVDAVKIFAEGLGEFFAGELTILVLVPIIESGRLSED